MIFILHKSGLKDCFMLEMKELMKEIN